MSLGAVRPVNGLEVIKFEVVSFDGDDSSTMDDAFNQRYVNALFDPEINSGNSYSKLLSVVWEISGIKGIIPNILDPYPIAEDIKVELNGEGLDDQITGWLGVDLQFVGSLPSGVRYLAAELSYGDQEERNETKSILRHSVGSHWAKLAVSLEEIIEGRGYENLAVFATNPMVSEDLRAAVAIAPQAKPDILLEELHVIAEGLFPEKAGNEPF